MPSLDSKSKIQYTKMHVEQYCSHRQIIYAKSNNSRNWESRFVIYFKSAYMINIINNINYF